MYFSTYGSSFSALNECHGILNIITTVVCSEKEINV